MNTIVEWGKHLYWVTSEWAASEIIEAIQIAERHHLHKPVVEQPQYNMFVRNRLEGDYERFYKDYNYGSTIWSPLASGLLTGKYKGGIPKDSRGALKGYDWLQNHLTDKEKLAKVDALEPIAKELGCSLSQLALAWGAKNPLLSTVIKGARRGEQVHEKMNEEDLIDKPTPELMEKVEKSLGVKKKKEEN